MARNVIAIVCDCDDTLAPDTTNYLLTQNGIDVDAFWEHHKGMVRDGWDPPIAWMTDILSLMRSGKIRQDTNDALGELGGTITPNNGLLDFIPDMHSMVQNEKAFAKLSVSLEFYIVSSGLEALIRGAPFSTHFKDIFGGTFAEDDKTGKITSIKSSVTFTEKTKYLYAINKGISGALLRENPYAVNKKILQDARPIPFEHMLYIGDSYNDIPCFSAVKQNRGQCVSIAANSKFKTGHQLGSENRVNMGPYKGDYGRGSDLYSAIEACIKGIGYAIVNESAPSV